MIVKTLAGGSVQQLVERIVLVFVAMPVEFAQNFFLGRREHGVEPAQHCHGEHDALVLGRTVRATQQIRDLPDEIGQFVMIGHGEKIKKCAGVSKLPPPQRSFGYRRHTPKPILAALERDFVHSPAASRTGPWRVFDIWRGIS